MRERKTRAGFAARHLADPRQAAILLLRRIELRNEDRKNPMTRAQFTAPMLRRLWNQPLLSPEFLKDVSAWLAVAGWCFFNAGGTYAVVRISAVKNWPRLGTNRMTGELDEVARGKFKFEEHEHLLIDDTSEGSDQIAVADTRSDQGSDDKSSGAAAPDNED